MIPANRENWKLLHGPLGADTTPNALFESSTSEGFGGGLDEPDGPWLRTNRWRPARRFGCDCIRGRARRSAFRQTADTSRSGTGTDELFYLQGEDVMSVTVDTSRGGFAFTPAVRLFGVRGPLATQPPSYDVTPTDRSS